MHGTRFMHSLVVERPDTSGSADSSIFSPYPNDFDDIVRGFSNDVTDNQPENLSCSVAELNGLYPLTGDLKFMESSDISGPKLLNGELVSEITSRISGENVYVDALPSPDTGLSSNASPVGANLQNLPNPLSQSLDTLSESASSVSSLVTDGAPSTTLESSIEITDTLNLTNEESLNLKESIDNFLSGVSKSVDVSIGRAQGDVKSSYTSLVSSYTDAVKRATESFDNAVNDLFSSAGNSREQASSEFGGLSNKLKENIYKTGTLATDILRRAIIIVEDSLSNAATFVVYSYGSAKSFLPPDIKNAINVSEEKSIEILRPVGAAIQQVSL